MTIELNTLALIYSCTRGQVRLLVILVTFKLVILKQCLSAVTILNLLHLIKAR